MQISATSPERRSSKERCTRSALLTIDLINPFDFPEGDVAFQRALPSARATGRLQARARSQGIPMIYVNEQFDERVQDLRDLFGKRFELGERERALADLLDFDVARDHLILKPKHSAFFSTELDALLEQLEVDHLILTGVAADICVLATAFDAHMRDFTIAIPRDCVAAESAEAETWALRHMSRIFCADVRHSDALTFSPVERSASRPG